MFPRLFIYCQNCDSYVLYFQTGCNLCSDTLTPQTAANYLLVFSILQIRPCLHVTPEVNMLNINMAFVSL